jgi:hypothetical protein
MANNVSWLTINPLSGSGNGSISVTAAANTGAARSATITVTAEGLQKTVTVSQGAYQFLLTLYTSGTGTTNPVAGTGVYKDYGTEFTITATPGDHWAFSKWSARTSSTASWTDLTSLTASTTITIGNNNYHDYQATFSQVEWYLTVTSNDANMGSTTGGNAWYASGTSVNISATSSGTNVFTKWSDNNTSASRTVTTTSAAVTYTANFAAGSITANPTSVSLLAAGETEDVTITSNLPTWVVDSAGTSTWFTATKQSATVLRVVVGVNPGTSVRTGTIKLTGSSTYSTVTRTISVSQAASAATLTLSPTSITITASDTAAKTVTVTSNTSWTVDAS